MLVKVLSVFLVSWVFLLLPSESKLASYLLTRCEHVRG